MVYSTSLLFLAAGVSSAPAVPSVAPARAPEAASVQTAPDWQNALIVIGKGADGVVWLVRAGDMANTANYRPILWVTKDHSQDRSTKARISRSLEAFDCVARTSDVRATIGFAPSGIILWSVQAETPDPRPIEPATVADLVRKNVCPKTSAGVDRP
jgi:hypothetical protein